MACEHKIAEHTLMAGCMRDCECNLNRAGALNVCGAMYYGTGAVVSHAGACECTKCESRAYDPPPKHYEGDGIMPWAVVDAWGLDFYLGNVLKYVCRAGKKEGAARLDDLEKARNYISKAIEVETKK